MPRRKTTAEFIADAKAIHGDKYDYSKVDYSNAHSKVCIICSEHGEFMQTPDKHLRGHGCSLCGNEKSKKFSQSRGTKDLFIEKASLLHAGKYDYSKVYYKDSQTKVCIICPEHGEFLQTPGNHLQGKGCPNCAIDCRSNFLRMGAGEFIDRAQSVHGWWTYDYSLVEYTNTDTKVKIICPEHGIFEQTPYHHLKGRGCLKCAPVSKAEENLYALLLKRFSKEDIQRQYKEKRYPWKCDFHIKSQDIFIELNGFFSHGSHFFTKSEEDWSECADWWVSYLDTDNKRYLESIQNWTKTDPLKKATAEKNNLNYIVFWDWENLTDAKDWLKTLCA